MYVIDFDIVAIVLSAISLYLYFSQKRVANRQNNIFFWLLWAVLGSSLFSAASSAAINSLRSWPVPLVLSLNTVFYLLHNSIPPIICRYIISVSASAQKPKRRKNLLLLPWALSISLILANPLTALVFYVDGSGAYRHGPALPVLYLASAFYLVVSVWYLLSRWKSLVHIQRLVFCIVFSLPLPAVIVQNLLQGYVLECFTAAVCSLFLLLTVQNSNELIDGQTGLYNRDAFLQFLPKSFARAKPFSMLLVHSEELTALQGLVDVHTYGQIQRTFSSWLACTAGKKTVVCALDSGQFALIVEQNDAEIQAGEIAMAIAERSREVWNIGPTQIEIPLRVGIIQCPRDASDVRDAVDYAVQLTNLSVLASSRHIFYASDFRSGKTGRDAAIADSLRAVIESGEPELRYQPVWSVTRQRPVALEVLIGVHTADGEWVRQSENQQIAEQIGVSRSIALLVLDRAFDWYVRNGLEARGIEQLQIRLVPALCVELDWPRVILQTARERNFNPARLCLEITETTVVNAGDSLKINMGLLAGQGVSFAMDDYGSGYTDFGQETMMPFSLIKLDKKIVQAAFQSRKGELLLGGSIRLFKHLRHDIVAEGVETAAQADLLYRMGADYLQGYHFGYPLEGDEILKQLGSRA